MALLPVPGYFFGGPRWPSGRRFFVPTPGDKHLAAYVSIPWGTTPSISELRAHVSGRLPAFMVPDHFEFVESLPLLIRAQVDKHFSSQAENRVLFSSGIVFRSPFTYQ